jgi:hypothetical protein
MYAYVYVRVLAYMYVCNVCTHVCMHARTYIRMYVRMHVRMHVRVCVCACMHACIRPTTPFDQLTDSLLSRNGQNFFRGRPLKRIDRVVTMHCDVIYENAMTVLSQ